MFVEKCNLFTILAIFIVFSKNIPVYIIFFHFLVIIIIMKEENGIQVIKEKKVQKFINYISNHVYC